MNQFGAATADDVCWGASSDAIPCLHDQSDHAHGPTLDLELTHPCKVCDCDDFKPVHGR